MPSISQNEFFRVIDVPHTCEGSKLLCEGEKDFIFVVDGFGQEWNQLGSCSFLSQSQSNSRELLDGVQTELERELTGFSGQCLLLPLRNLQTHLNVLVLELID